MLLFKKEFLPAIRQGRKRQTIRLWPYRRMRPGQRSYIPGVGPIRIVAVEPIRLEELTEEDARADGFESLEQLHQALRRIYAQADSGKNYQPYRVRFELLFSPAAENYPQTSSGQNSPSA